MRKIPLKGKYNWNYTLALRCRKEDVDKLKETLWIPWKKKYNATMPFNAFMSCVVFPDILKYRKEHTERIGKLIMTNKQRKDFV
jgi:hypothetical protein